MYTASVGRVMRKEMGLALRHTCCLVSARVQNTKACVVGGEERQGTGTVDHSPHAHVCHGKRGHVCHVCLSVRAVWNGVCCAAHPAAAHPPAHCPAADQRAVRALPQTHHGHSHVSAALIGRCCYDRQGLHCWGGHALSGLPGPSTLDPCTQGSPYRVAGSGLFRCLKLTIRIVSERGSSSSGATATGRAEKGCLALNSQLPCTWYSPSLLQPPSGASGACPCCTARPGFPHSFPLQHAVRGDQGRLLLSAALLRRQLQEKRGVSLSEADSVSLDLASMGLGPSPGEAPAADKCVPPATHIHVPT